MKGKKWYAAVLACGMLLSPVAAFAVDNVHDIQTETTEMEVLGDRAVAEAAIKAIEPFSDSLMACYQKEYVKPNTGDFTNSYLHEQLSMRNWYLARAQSVYEILQENSRFIIERVNVVDEDTVKILARRYILQEMYHEETGSFPFKSNTNEGYVLKKIDGQWKIARYIDNIYEISDQIGPFIEDFANTVMPPTPENYEEAVIQDLSGVDYIYQYESKDLIRVIWNGEFVNFPDQQPVAIDGVTMVPMRPIVDLMPDHQTVNIVQDRPWWVVSIAPQDGQDGYYYEFHQGHDGEAPFYTVDYYKDGEKDPALHQRVEMSTQIQSMGGRLMVPLRALVSPYANVEWRELTNTVYVTSYSHE